MSVSLPSISIGAPNWGGTVNNYWSQIQAALQTYGARCSSSDGQSMAGSGTRTTVIFPTVDYNIGTIYNSSSGYFTAPIDGLYDIKGQIHLSSLASGQALILWLQKSSGSFADVCQSPYVINPSNNLFGVAVSTTLLLGEGDQIRFQCAHSSPSSIALAANVVYNFASVHLINIT